MLLVTLVLWINHPTLPFILVAVNRA